MTELERKKVNKEQINKFFASYYSEWRHIHILSIAKKLRSKYDFYSDIIEEIKETDLNASEKTIAQQIRNGLVFDAIQSSVQYIEDLFALLNASKNQDFFIRNIVQYGAGKIEALIKGFKFNKENICKFFHFPFYPETEADTEEEKETLKVMYESLDRLSIILKEIVEYYKKHQFFYNQYKHGLSIALRPYNDYSDEQVESDKNGVFEDFSVVALDSLNFKGAFKNQYGNAGYLMMPCFSEDIRPHLKQLQKENNLLRYVMSPPETTIKTTLDIAKKTKRCIHILITNFLEIVNENSPKKYRLPAEDESQVIEFKIDA